MPAYPSKVFLWSRSPFQVKNGCPSNDLLSGYPWKLPPIFWGNMAVFTAKHETKQGIYTGTLSILMDVQHNIPSALRIRGHTCLIFYRGQTRTCFRCQSPDHTMRSHQPPNGDDSPPTPDTPDNPSEETPMSQDQPPSAASSTPPEDPVSQETITEMGQDDTQPEAPTQTSPAEDGNDGAHTDDTITRGETNPPLIFQILLTQTSTALKQRTGEETFTISPETVLPASRPPP